MKLSVYNDQKKIAYPKKIVQQICQGVDIFKQLGY